jgi:hypothetical protein
MKKFAVALLALAASACGKQTFLAAAFIETPQVPNPVDPAHPIPAFAVMSAYLGTVDTTNPTRIDANKIAVVPGASAFVAFRHLADKSVAGDADEDRLITAGESAGQPGLYTVTSQDQAKLTFEQNVPYTLILTTPGAQSEAFGARITPGPPATIQEFPAGAPVVEQAVAHSFVVTRTDNPVSGDRLPAFIVVGKIDPQNPKSEPQITFKTVPAQPIDMLKFVLSDADYRWASYTIPATAFPDVNAFYVVSVLTVRTGKVSENAFLGSTAIAATGAAGLVHTHL